MMVEKLNLKEKKRESEGFYEKLWKGFLKVITEK